MQPRKLLLIDTRVHSEALINARKYDVDYIMFDFYEYNYAKLQEDINAKLEEVQGLVYTDIALIQHGHPDTQYQIVGNSQAANIEESTPYASFEEIKEFLQFLQSKGLERFDFLACALYSHANMQNIFAYLESETGVDLRASTNFTGEFPNGDWIQESDNVDIREHYFTEAISDFTELLYFTYYRESRQENDLYIFVGTTDTCAILVKSTGKIYTWGSNLTTGNVASQITTFGVVKNGSIEIDTFVDIACTSTAIAGLTRSGEIWAWGNVANGGLGANATTPAILKDSVGTILTGFTKIYSTNTAFAAIQGQPGVNSKVYAWGSSSGGSLGANAKIGYTNTLLNGTTAIYSNDTNFASIIGSISPSKVYCWGNTANGHLHPTGGSATATVPGTHTNLNDVHTIYNTMAAFVGVKGSNESTQVWAWGLSSSGSLTTSSRIPGTSALLNGTTKIFTSINNVIAIVGSGTSSKVYTWGITGTTSLHLSSSSTDRTNPVTHSDLDGTTDILTTYTAALAIKGSEKWTWGSVSGGHIGTTSTIPATNSILNNSTKIVAAYQNFAAIVDDNGTSKVYTWGGTGGIFSLSSTSKLGTNELLNGVSDIYPSLFNYVAKIGDSYWTWGLFDNNIVISVQPFQLTMPGISSINVCKTSLLTILSDKNIYSFGGSPSPFFYISELYGIPKIQYSSVNHNIGGNVSVLLDDNGTPYTYTPSNRGYIPTGLTGVSFVKIVQTNQTFNNSTGIHNAVAGLTTTGDVWAWGSSTYGGLGDAGKLEYSNIIDIVAGTRGFAALGANGNVYAWGTVNITSGSPVIVKNSSGLPLENVTKIISNYLSFAAIVGTGSSAEVYIWGEGGGTLGTSTANGIASTHPDTIGVKEIYNTYESYAIIKHDGSVWNWGTDARLGAATTPTTNLNLNGTTKIFANKNTYAFVVGSGATSKIYTLGTNASLGGSSSSLGTSSQLDGIDQLYVTDDNFAYIKNGEVYVWGNPLMAGLWSNSDIATNPILSGTSELYSTASAFIARKANGTVYTWGVEGTGHLTTDRNIPATDAILTNITDIYTNHSSVLVKRTDGTFWAWGNVLTGGYTGTGAATIYNIPIDIAYVYPSINEHNESRYARNFIVKTNDNRNYTIGIQNPTHYYTNNTSTDSYPKIFQFKENPIISWISSFSATVGDSPITLDVPTSTSSGSFSYSSSNNNIVSINDRIVTFVGEGTATITATQSSTPTYNTLSVSIIITVTANKISPTQSWIAPFTKYYGDAAFSLSAPTSNSTGAFTYSSSNQAVATTNGSTVTITGVGKTTLTASQDATTNYNAKSITVLLTVDKGTPTISWLTSITKLTTDGNFTITTPTSNSLGTFSYMSSNPAVAEIHPTTGAVTFKSGGSTTITATQGSTDFYNSELKQLTLTYNRVPQQATGFSNITLLVNESVTITPTFLGGVQAAYNLVGSSAQLTTGTGNQFTLTGVSQGTATLTAATLQTNIFNVGAFSITVTVKNEAGETTGTTDLNNEIFYVHNKVILTPDVTLSTFALSSDDNTKVAVENRTTNGIIRFLKNGPVNITTLHDGVPNKTIQFAPRPAVTTPAGVVTEITQGNPKRAFESYQIESGLSIKEAAARVKAQGVNKSAADYNTLTNLVREYVLETVPVEQYKEIPGGRVVTYSSPSELAAQIDSMIVKSSNIPNMPIDVVFPVVQAGQTPTINLTTLSTLIRFDMASNETLTLTVGDTTAELVFIKDDTDPYVTLNGVRFNIDDKFVLGGKLLQIVAFGGVTLYNVFQPIDIQLPIHIDAGTFAMTLETQGELVKYNKVHIPLVYKTAVGDPSAASVGELFRWKESADQTKVDTELLSPDGKSVLQNLFVSALNGTQLMQIGLSGEGIVYADNTPRNTMVDPVCYYLNEDQNCLRGDLSGSTVKSYLEQYLYDNLNAVIGLAATTGKININMNRTENGTVQSAAEIIAASLSEQLAKTEDVVASAIRQSIYEQMFLKAPDRFLESELMRKEPAANSTYRGLPFYPGDTIAFITTFKFPAEKILSPVVLNALRSGSLLVNVGNKIEVTATEVANPVFNDFPDATVMLRIEFTS